MLPSSAFTLARADTFQFLSTFAALALATDPATPASLRRQPDRSHMPLITPQMWMMIIGQAIYQIIVALTLHFAGARIFNLFSEDLAQEIDFENELK
jgi:Ca2+-transporting ATPase